MNSSFVDEYPNVSAAHIDTLNPKALASADFYWSFYYSQGSDDLQHELFIQIAKQYKQTLTLEQQAQVLEHTNAGSEIISRFRIPKKHTQDTSYPQNDTAENELRKFHTTLDENFGESHGIALVTDMTRGLRVIDGLIISDRWYQPKERHMDDDVHASNFRRYILLKQPAKLATYEAIFGSLRNIWEHPLRSQHPKAEKISSRLASLALEWEINHPNEVFFPQGRST